MTRRLPHGVPTPKFVIERTFPAAGTLTQLEIEDMMSVHCEVVKAIGLQIQWIESYLTADKVYYIYIAPDAELGGFPIDSILEIERVLESRTLNLWIRSQPAGASSPKPETTAATDLSAASILSCLLSWPFA